MKDVFNNVVARNALRAMRRPSIPAQTPSVAATTKTTPLDPHTIYGAFAAHKVDAGTATGKLSWKPMASVLRSEPRVFLLGSLDATIVDEIHCRVHQFVERRSVLQHGNLYGDLADWYCSYPEHNHAIFLVDLWGSRTDAVSAFATENTTRLPASEHRHAPGAFNCVEFVEERDARAQRLLAELQNGAAHGQASVQRLRELQDAAMEEGEPFSLDALEALVMFASVHPSMPVPEITLSVSGSIVAEWRRPNLSVTLYFVSPISVQYLVKRRNPWYRRLPERTSGATTVDRVGETLKAFLTSEWPIRA